MELEPLSRDEEDNSWIVTEDRYNRAAIFYVSSYIFEDRPRNQVPKLPPEATIIRLGYDYNRDALMVIFHHPKLQKVARGEVYPSYAPYVRELPDGSGQAFWPKDWIVSCKQ